MAKFLNIKIIHEYHGHSGMFVQKAFGSSMVSAVLNNVEHCSTNGKDLNESLEVLQVTAVVSH